MTTDNAEFIARHHRVPSEKKDTRKLLRRRFRYGMMMVILVCLYVAVSFGLSTFISFDPKVIFVIAASMFSALGILYGVKKLFRIVSLAEKDGLLLKQVLEGSRGARLITDGRDRTRYFNSNFVLLCDKANPSLQDLADLFGDDEEADSHFRVLADQAYRGLTDSVELKSIKDDAARWYQVTAQPVSQWKGYIHWRVDDVTDRHVSDRAIRDEREKLIDFTDNAPVGFFSVDEKGRFVFVNATFARWLGMDIKSLLRNGTLHTFLEKIPDNAEPYDVVAGGGAKQMAEVMMKGPGGKTFTASISQVVVHEAEGIVRTRGVVHDLTAERAMRQALKMSEDRFERFFAEAPLGIAILTDSGDLEDCNPALVSMLGFKDDDLEGRQLEALVHEHDRASVISALDKMEGGYLAPIEIMLLGAKENVAVQMVARQLGGTDNLVLHFTDLTKQKTLEQQFAQSQKMQAVGQLAGGVAHDFNNLLTAMIGFCDLLLLRHKAGDPSFSDIMQIKQNANRASNLVRQLLAFSRQQTLRPKVQDITDILIEVSHLMRRLIGANIELDVSHGQDLGLVKVDAGQMEQVLINLAVNARDAMDHQGKLTIETAHFTNERPMECGSDEMPAGDWVSIAVTDTGTGIDPENLTRILEPFFTTKEVGQGTGLGLATCYGIIRQTGGYLHIESKLGEGTTFTIYLPRLLENEEETEVKKVVDDTPKDLTGSARILLVEDEDAVRTFSSRALTNKGYEVVEANCGEDGLEKFKGLTDEQMVDLLITDVIMPNMDGPTLANHIKETAPDLKVIFISGYTEEKLKEHMGDNIWFLPKPFTLKQLAEKVKEALEG